jgi:hypothetical protein
LAVAAISRWSRFQRGPRLTELPQLQR